MSALKLIVVVAHLFAIYRVEWIFATLDVGVCLALKGLDAVGGVVVLEYHDEAWGCDGIGRTADEAAERSYEVVCHAILDLPPLVAVQVVGFLGKSLIVSYL